MFGDILVSFMLTYNIVIIPGMSADIARIWLDRSKLLFVFKQKGVLADNVNIA